MCLLWKFSVRESYDFYLSESTENFFTSLILLAHLFIQCYNAVTKYYTINTTKLRHLSKNITLSYLHDLEYCQLIFLSSYTKKRHILWMIKKKLFSRSHLQSKWFANKPDELLTLGNVCYIWGNKLEWWNNFEAYCK